MIRVALEPGGLGAARQIPQPDRLVPGARSEPPADLAQLLEKESAYDGSVLI
jgi:hypothetical protein